MFPYPPAMVQLPMKGLRPGRREAKEDYLLRAASGAAFGYGLAHDVSSDQPAADRRTAQARSR